MLNMHDTCLLNAMYSMKVFTPVTLFCFTNNYLQLLSDNKNALGGRSFALLSLERDYTKQWHIFGG